ncbi:MAG: hypothetical protein GX152_03685 [Methanosarcina sp.]|nr:hypothetical protein [Methanosarcina sp.]
MTNQNWFEMPDVRRRTFANAVWIPLRAMNSIREEGKSGHEGYISEFLGVGSIAVPINHKKDAEKLGWDDVGIRLSHSGCVENEEYTPAHIYKDFHETFIGEHFVLEQRGNRKEHSEWHLSQDFAITLGLKREGDIWVRIDEGYIEVAKLSRKENGSPFLLEVRASHLKDYLCARGMALYLVSYRDRIIVAENRDLVSWNSNPISETNKMDRWEGRVSEIHEGGMPFGGSIAVINIVRTDVDPEEDVPAFGLPTDGSTISDSWTNKFKGKKLFRIEGQLWRKEWIEPATSSPIVRDDEETPTVFFITDAEGKRESRESLVHGGRWLWFRPEVIMALAHRRGGSLSWYTRDTGSVGCSPDYTVHFGINSLGLLNVYAKDIGLLPEWQQRIWAGYNVGPDGKVSKELLASQIYVEPADTQAPEALLEVALKQLMEISAVKLGFSVLKKHDSFSEVLEQTHRFRAIDKAGLCSLAKDIARLTADSIDAASIQTIVKPPKGEKWGSLKSLENLIAKKVSPENARSMLSSLVGAYELRLGDAHLPGNDFDDAFDLVGIDRSLPFVHQGYQLLDSCVISIFKIVKVFKAWDKI